jgi:GNAT superfamily N-acetyltransferase
VPTFIRSAAEPDVPVILDFIRQLAEYERLSHQVTATEDRIRQTLFGPRPAAEVLLADMDSECAGFAVFFGNYSTYLAQPGLYLEDLYVKPHWRGQGVGLALLRRVAEIAVERGCGRVEWSALDWNESSIRFYKNLGAEELSDLTRYRLTGQTLEKLAGCQ